MKMTAKQRKRLPSELMPKGKSFLIWNIPEGVKKSFKKCCAGRGITMRDAIVKFMIDFPGK